MLMKKFSLGIFISFLFLSPLTFVGEIKLTSAKAIGETIVLYFNLKEVELVSIERAVKEKEEFFGKR